VPRTYGEVVGKKVDLSEQRLREALDPDYFVEVTNSQGRVVPKEGAQMITDPRTALNKARSHHVARIEKLEQAREFLVLVLQKFYRDSK
jgi:hypothetical protein